MIWLPQEQTLHFKKVHPLLYYSVVQQGRAWQGIVSTEDQSVHPNKNVNNYNSKIYYYSSQQGRTEGGFQGFQETPFGFCKPVDT